jgi:4-hydroxyacetophenone monooxygenase
MTPTGITVNWRSWAKATGPNGCRCRPTWAQRSRRICAEADHGPNAQGLPSGHQLPALFVIWSSYVAQCISKLLTDQKTRVEVTEEAFEAYNQRLDAQAAKLIFMDKRDAPDKNYYVNQKHNRLQVNAPWWGPDFYRMCSTVEWHDLRLS